jgi:hypothetical protein
LFDPGRNVAGDDLPIDQYGNTVGEVKHDAHVVLDHDQGAALADLRIKATARSVSSVLIPALGSSNLRPLWAQAQPIEGVCAVLPGSGIICGAAGGA